MEFSEIVALIASIGSVLALVASMVSAAGAARSADKATEAERRALFNDRIAVRREMNRASATLAAETKITIRVLESAVLAVDGLAILTGGLGSSRNKLLKEELQASLDTVARLGEFSKIVHIDAGSDEQVAVQQIKLDEALIYILAEKEAGARKLAEYQREREVLLLKPHPFPPR